MLEKSAEMSANLQKISFFEKVKHQSITLRRTGSDAGKQIKKIHVNYRYSEKTNVNKSNYDM